MSQDKKVDTGTQEQDRATPYLDLSVLRSTKDTARTALAVAVIAAILVIGLGAYTRNALQEIGAEGNRAQSQMTVLSEQMAGEMAAIRSSVDESLSGLDEAMVTAVDERLSGFRDILDQRFAAIEQATLARLRTLEAQMVSLEQVEAHVQDGVLRAALADMATQLEALRAQAPSGQAGERLSQAQALLAQVEQDLAGK